MTRTFILIIFLTALLFAGCEDDRVPSGVEATVFWAECDTMQMFSDYNGLMYFIPYSDYYKLSDSTWEIQKKEYNAVSCSNGSVSNFLEPGEYFAEPDSFFSASEPLKFSVRPDVLEKVEIRFIYCP